MLKSVIKNGCAAVVAVNLLADATADDHLHSSPRSVPIGISMTATTCSVSLSLRLFQQS